MTRLNEFRTSWDLHKNKKAIRIQGGIKLWYRRKKAPAQQQIASAKRTAAKAEEALKAVVHIQFGGDKDIIAKDILDKAVENYKSGLL